MPGITNTHLDTEFNLAQKLDLMFWDKLGKRYEEPDLESSHSVVRQSIPAPVNMLFIIGNLQSIFRSKDKPYDPAEAKGDDI